MTNRNHAVSTVHDLHISTACASNQANNVINNHLSAM